MIREALAVPPRPFAPQLPPDSRSIEQYKYEATLNRGFWGLRGSLPACPAVQLRPSREGALQRPSLPAASKQTLKRTGLRALLQLSGRDMCGKERTPCMQAFGLHESSSAYNMAHSHGPMLSRQGWPEQAQAHQNSRPQTKAWTRATLSVQPAQLQPQPQQP